VSQELILKRASASRPSGKWSEDDYDVLADGAVVGRIMKAYATPVGSPWFWTLASAIIATAGPHTVMRRTATPRWPPSPRAGGANEVAASKAPMLQRLRISAGRRVCSNIGEQ
jgi:hypothetical protein